MKILKEGYYYVLTRLKSVSPEVMDNFKASVQQCTTTQKGKTLDMHWRHDRSCRNSDQISDRTPIPTRLLFPTRLLSFYSYSFVAMTTEAIPVSLATSIAMLWRNQKGTKSDLQVRSPSKLMATKTIEQAISIATRPGWPRPLRRLRTSLGTA